MQTHTDNSTGIRQPAVAGHFYPAAAEKLQLMVSEYLDQARPLQPAPKAVIAPHAGYIFSGPVAASAYAGWHGLGTSVHRVVLLGPAHRVYLRGLAVPANRTFMTPLGAVPVDAEGIAAISTMPGIITDDLPHADEHSLEVQLPFLQTLFPEFALVPIVVGDAKAADIAAVLEKLWGGDETRIVISSDLSHYHDYNTASEIDTATSAAITALDIDSIGPDQACGCMPLRGMMHYARDHGLQIRELDRRNSGDTAGPRDHVVGYGAYAIQS